MTSPPASQSVADLRRMLAEAEGDQPMLDALHAIVQAGLTALDAQTNVIVAVTSIIAVEPGNRFVTGFANDAIESSVKTLDAIEAIDKALDILLAPYSDRYENLAHSVKVTP